MVNKNYHKVKRMV